MQLTESNWVSQATCRTVDPRVFDGRQVNKYGPVDYSAARAVCRVCPVTAECLADAVKYGDTACMRAGLTPGEYGAFSARSRVAV